MQVLNLFRTNCSSAQPPTRGTRLQGTRMTQLPPLWLGAERSE